MTYLGFHLLFILPPIALLALRQRGSAPDRRRWLHLAAVILLAIVYTTPWDNYLVWRGIWWYGEDRVMGTIGYVPVEEYLFFMLQPVLTGLWFYSLPAVTRPSEGSLPPPSVQPPPSGAKVRIVGAAIYFAVAAAGFALLTTTPGTYMGLILAWAAPVLGLQWAYAGGEIAARAREFVIGVAVPTVHLWVADAIAISSGIWRISEEFTLGPQIGPLPIEEATFFLATNLLVVQGLILFRYPPGGLSTTSASREEAVR